jgi:hypothetical protein
MKNTFRTLVAFCLFLLALTVTAQAADKAPQPPADNSSPELQKIKSLEGRWSSTTSMFGKPNEKVYTEYEVTSGGSAVLERIFPGTSNEMVSVYYDDDKGRLAMTHYCIMRNRPTLKLASSNADTITMDVSKIEGLKSKKDPAMGGATLHFIDQNHFETSCEAKGKDKKEPMTMTYTRVGKK